MSTNEIKESLESHSDDELLEMYEWVVKSPNIRDNNEEFTDLISDIIADRLEKVNNILG